jgi:hypothetical protein
MPSKQPVWYYVLVVEHSCGPQFAADEAPIIFNDFFQESIGTIEQDGVLVIEDRAIYNREGHSRPL